MLIDLNYNVWGFGSNRYGELGYGSEKTEYLEPTQLIGFKSLQIVCSFDTTMMIGTLLL